jgi:hypothetical protein
MGFNSIPNQPILFEDPIFANQSCLNKDIRAYAQLLQAGDTMCVQLFNQGDLSTYDLQPLTINGNIISNGDFSNNLTDWHQGDIATSTDDGPWPWGASFDWFLSNGGAQRMSSATKGIGQTLTTGTFGDLMLISLDFETYQSIGGIQIFLGTFSTNNWNSVIRQGTDPVNFDGRYTVVLSSYLGLDVWFDATTAGSKPLLKDIRTYNCTGLIPFIPTPSFADGWMYVESCNGYQVMGTNYLINTTFNLFTGTNYAFSFSIKNLQEGSIDIFDVDGNLIVSATENRDYEVFLSYTGTTGPMQFNVSNALSVGGILYNFKIATECFDHRFKLVNSAISSESAWFDKDSLDFPVKYYNGRIFWCFDMADINDFDTGTPLQTGCYNIVIDDCGDGEYTSYTTINYTTGSHPCSVWMEGDCTTNAFDFFFKDSVTDIEFKLGQRLRLLQFNPTYPITSEDYVYSNGYMTRTSASTSKKREAWFDYVDEPTHDVIRCQLLCDVLKIDQKEFFFVAGDYQPEWSQNGQYNLAQSRVELMAVEEKTLFNKNCI